MTISFKRSRDPTQDPKVKKAKKPKKPLVPESSLLWLMRVAMLWGGFVLVEAYCVFWLHATDVSSMGFSALWAVVFTSICLMLPRKAGQVVYGILYLLFALYGVVQSGYYRVFGKMIWLSDINYADEGTPYLGNILFSYPLLFWLFSAVLLALAALFIRLMPVRRRTARLRVGCTAMLILAVLCIGTLPGQIFNSDARSRAESLTPSGALSKEDIYSDLYDAHALYSFCGLYQTVFRDLYHRTIYPYTGDYAVDTQQKTEEIEKYLSERTESSINYMTGVFAGKNVILVLMESMDDWLISPEHTPTISRLMDEGIEFANFYTPGYGSARTYNTEFCVNTGMFVPTDGTYTFDYAGNTFNESMANSFRNLGYTAKVFHYNSPDFYSRGIMEVAVGYEEYVSYEDYVSRPEELLNDSYMLQQPELRELFFRTSGTDQPFFNFVITRSAHLGYKYDDDLSLYALYRHPEYYRYSDDEELNCALAKARLVDDMFSDLLTALEEEGYLDNTVIIAFTDHYTYGMEDINQVMELSGVDNKLEVERTPCFIWAQDGPNMTVNKVMSTADLLPTVLNLFGIDNGYTYLGRDCFDPYYTGFVVFSTGEWITGDCIYDGETVVRQISGRTLSPEYFETMNVMAQRFINVNNMLLRSDYYNRP